MKYILVLIMALCGPTLWAQTDACEQYNEQGDSLLQAGQYDRALSSYRRAQHLAHRRGDRVAEAVALTNQGVAYRITEHADSALYCYQQALALAQQSGDKSELSHVLCSIAILYANTSRVAEAERYARWATRTAHASRDIDMIMYCDYTYGSILTLRARYTEAIATLRAMAAEARRQNRPNYMLKGYTAIIDYFLKMKTTAPAHKRSAVLADSIDHYIAVCDTLFRRVSPASPEGQGYLEEKYLVLRQLGRYRESIAVQQLMLSLRPKGLITPPDRLYTIMARNYADLHQPTLAAKCYEQALTAKDSMAQTAIDSQLSEFTARFDTAQKELEIARLSARQNRLLAILAVVAVACVVLGAAVWLVRRGARLRSARRYIEGMEQERDRLGHELHDGIAGDLLGLSLCLSSQPVEESAQMLRDLHQDVRRISHELMPPRFAHTSFQECARAYLQTVAGATFSSTPGVVVAPHVAFQLYRVLQETVTNIRRHAHATYIHVELSAHQLVIENDGYLGQQGDGAGSQSLSERARAIHATLTYQYHDDICRQILTLRR